MVCEHTSFKTAAHINRQVDNSNPEKPTVQFFLRLTIECECGQKFNPIDPIFGGSMMEIVPKK